MNVYYEAIHQVIRTGHWITDQVSIELREFGITEPQYNVLRILRGQGSNPITVREIQERMIQRTSNVTRIIDKLLLKELVDRNSCIANRRKVDITITNKGLNFLSQLDKKVSEFHKPMQGNLTIEEQKMLTTLIIKLKRGNKNEKDNSHRSQ